MPVNKGFPDVGFSLRLVTLPKDTIKGNPYFIVCGNISTAHKSNKAELID